MSFKSSDAKSSSSFGPTNSGPRDWYKALTVFSTVPNEVARHFLNIMTPVGRKIVRGHSVDRDSIDY